MQNDPKAMYDAWLKVQSGELPPESDVARATADLVSGDAATDRTRFADSVEGVVTLGDVAEREDAWNAMRRDLSRAWSR